MHKQNRPPTRMFLLNDDMIVFRSMFCICCTLTSNSVSNAVRNEINLTVYKNINIACNRHINVIKINKVNEGI